MSLIHKSAVALREVCDAEDLKALRERNEKRAAEARYRLGRDWLCHPDNRVRPQPQQRGVLRLAR